MRTRRVAAVRAQELVSVLIIGVLARTCKCFIFCFFIFILTQFYFHRKRRQPRAGTPRTVAAPLACAHLREAAAGVDSKMRQHGNSALDGNDALRKGNTGMQSGDQQQCAAADQRCIWDGVPLSQPHDQQHARFFQGLSFVVVEV